MKKFVSICAGFALLLVALTGCGPKPPAPPEPITNKITETKVVVYDGPSNLTTSEKVKIEVENEELFVYETRVNHGRVFTWTYSKEYNAYSYFDFEGRVNVKMTFPENVTSAKISPLAYNIQPTINGKTITFTLEQPSAYVIEINDDADNAVHLFANPLEVDAPKKGDDKVIYLEPGMYDAGAIALSAGDTLYLSGGAYVYGYIRSELANNITIRGRGVLAGDIYGRTREGEATTPIELRSGKNLKIEGIIMVDPAGWAVTLYNCDGVEVDNVKIMTARANGDGISVQGSKNVTVKGGFVRSWDDSLVVKNNDDYNTENILFDGVVVWTDLAQSMEVGFETNGDYMKDITFQNITVVHNYHKAVISMHNADRANISNVTYKNITLEHGEMLGDNRTDLENDFFIDIKIVYDIEWSKHAELGSIDGVTIENVKVLDVADSVVSYITGYPTSNSSVKNVKISNIDYKGVQVSKMEDLGMTLGNLANAPKFTKGEATGAEIAQPYDLSDLTSKVTVDKVTAKPQEGVIVPEFARLQGDLPYLGHALDVPVSEINVSRNVGVKNATPASDGVSGSFDTLDHPSSNIFDGKHDTYFESKPYVGVESPDEPLNEFIAVQIKFSKTMFFGSVRLYGNSENICSYGFALEIRAIRAGTTPVNWPRIYSKTEQTMTPTDGNVIDINIAADNYDALEFRFFPIASEYRKTSKVTLSEIELFAPSIAFKKTVVESTQYNDVYEAKNITDGSRDTYYESIKLNDGPCTLIIDLKDVYQASVISLHLPPAATWETRRQEIELFACADNALYNASTTQFTSIFAKQSVTFSPSTGNMKVINFESPVAVRLLKIVIYSNDIAAGYGAQLSEVMIFE